MWKKFVGFAMRVVVRVWPEIKKPLADIGAAIVKAISAEWNATTA